MSVHSAPPPTKIITGEELAALGDIGPCELIEGKIVTMSPTGYEHGNVEMRVGAIVYDFVRRHDLGKVQVGEVGIYIRRNPDTIRAADVLFISNERYAQRQSRSYLDVAPELVVEILSPDDRWSEVKKKLKEYFNIGVKLVWIRNPQNRIVTIYRGLTEVQELTVNDVLTGADILPGLSIPIRELFED